MNYAGAGTALITGASSGIGAEFARQLAAQGYRLALSARRKDRLEAFGRELANRYRVQTEILPADLADPGDVARIEAWIAQSPDLSLLVNNAGFGLQNKFSTGDIDKHCAMIQVHIIASVRLTHAALPGMLARQRGRIINVASVAAFTPYGRGSITYAVTKAYLLNFSQALQSELRATPIRIQALCPGFTYSEFHETGEFSGFDRASVPAFLWMPAEEVVKTSLHDLERGKVVCVPGWFYQVGATFLRSSLGSWLVRMFVR